MVADDVAASTQVENSGDGKPAWTFANTTALDYEPFASLPTIPQ
jgi:hypothetical protein